MRLIKDTKGDSTLLFLLFLIVISVMFLHATVTISRNVALRSQVIRISEEIAMNVASAGMDMTAATEGRTEIDQITAENIARGVLTREGVTGATYTISLQSGSVLVDLRFNNMRATSAVRVLNIN